MGLKQVPVHVASELTPAQARAYRIADNQTASIADWDYKLLPPELNELREMDFDLGMLGFDEEELNRILSGGVEGGLSDPDEVPPPPDTAITQPGDLWVLGRTACSAATAATHQISTVCSTGRRFTWSIPTPLTT